MLARMTDGRARRFGAGMAVACGVALAAACGNYRPNGIEFRFTPIPVVVSDLVLGTPVSIDPVTCNAFTADRVGVSIDEKEGKGFERWLDDIGFVVVRVHPQPPGAGARYYEVQVPSGSVPAAVALIGKQGGVRKAEPEFHTLQAPEARPIGEALGCKTPVSQGGQP
jgi:hypothetical protein